jgi:UDP-galactopyranose mutase
MNPDIIIVGAGITGISAAAFLSENSNKKILIIESRPVIGGMCRDEYKNGILYHLYGAHFFHTKNKSVWNFVNKYSDWILVTHFVKSYCFGKYWNVPLLESEINENYVEEIRNAIYVNYSQKMWNGDYEGLRHIINKRVDDKLQHLDGRYFQDIYQGLPKDGYTKMFENMISHSNISVLTGINYLDISEEFENIPTIYTGRLDELLSDYCLPYKSIYFDFEERNIGLKYPVVNYPIEYDFIKSVDYRLFLNQNTMNTIICREYPEENDKCNRMWEDAYPILTDDNVNHYFNLSNKVNKDYPYIYPAGRVGRYKYNNMDECIDDGINIAKKILKDYE